MVPIEPHSEADCQEEMKTSVPTWRGRDLGRGLLSVIWMVCLRSLCDSRLKETVFRVEPAQSYKRYQLHLAGIPAAKGYWLTPPRLNVEILRILPHVKRVLCRALDVSSCLHPIRRRKKPHRPEETLDRESRSKRVTTDAKVKHSSGYSTLHPLNTPLSRDRCDTTGHSLTSYPTKNNLQETLDLKWDRTFNHTLSLQNTFDQFSTAPFTLHHQFPSMARLLGLEALNVIPQPLCKNCPNCSIAIGADHACKMLLFLPHLLVFPQLLRASRGSRLGRCQANGGVFREVPPIP